MSNNTNFCVLPSSDSTSKTQSILQVRGSTLTSCYSAPVMGACQIQPCAQRSAYTRLFMDPVELDRVQLTNFEGINFNQYLFAFW